MQRLGLKRLNNSTGYGMTEITGMSHMTPSDDPKHGSVGVLLPNLECKVQWWSPKVVGRGHKFSSWSN